MSISTCGDPTGNLHNGQLTAEALEQLLRGLPASGPPQLQSDDLRQHAAAQHAAQLRQLGLSEEQFHLLALHVSCSLAVTLDPHSLHKLAERADPQLTLLRTV